MRRRELAMLDLFLESVCRNYFIHPIMLIINPNYI